MKTKTLPSPAQIYVSLFEEGIIFSIENLPSGRKVADLIDTNSTPAFLASLKSLITEIEYELDDQEFQHDEQ